MAQKKKASKASKQARKPFIKGRQPITQRERTVLLRSMRQVYCWRYVDHARAEAGEPIPESDHGYNLLVPSTPRMIDFAYDLASHHPMHWQVLVISYLRHEGETSRLWAWVKSQTPIVAAGEGITPLLTHALDAVRSDEEDAECFARATIMAPWDDQHPIRPDRLAGRLQTKLGLTKEEVLSLSEWDAPETAVIEADNIDLEIAKALRAAEA